MIAALLQFTDLIDNAFFYYFNYEKFRFKKYDACTQSDYYQVYDKTNDVLGYVTAYLFLLIFVKNDFLLLGFILYRIVGFVLFSWTHNHHWLILFFDFVKEYLLYIFFFGKKMDLFIPFILCKIFF